MQDNESTGTVAGTRAGELDHGCHVVELRSLLGQCKSPLGAYTGQERLHDRLGTRLAILLNSSLVVCQRRALSRAKEASPPPVLRVCPGPVQGPSPWRGRDVDQDPCLGTKSPAGLLVLHPAWATSLIWLDLVTHDDAIGLITLGLSSPRCLA
ncbi:hypothetical protein BDP81DRAFT_142371 [Colletotrichum phormii]|uniref:Uncharacterized protein n=1 Tax=Colletotrichum phormii TaxID=359342 RepID=A0AAI9ZDU6_9PEZI|nr:uncharacterized protein BDP81DRAFT_142371 [Colletotrichum phormii]KAK1622714.1 hypothetical protein BDP81DRAFT_142371 [Colletotrichum phormii]